MIMIIDSKKYGGRKRILALGLFTFSLCELIMFFYKKPIILVGMTLIRICDKVVWISLH